MVSVDAGLEFMGGVSWGKVGRKGGASPDALRHLFFDGALGNAELLRDLFLGQAVGGAQREDLPATLGQRLDGAGQEFELLLFADSGNDIGAIR